MNELQVISNTEPTTQDNDMNIVRKVFEKAANAMVDASQLAKEVAELREAVASLRAEVESLRENNKWLDEQIVVLRRARDEALSAQSTAQWEANAAKVERDDAVTRLNGVTNELTQTREERDNYRMASDQLTVDKANVQRDKDDAYSHWQQSEEENHRLKDEVERLKNELDSWHQRAILAEEIKDAHETRLKKVHEAIAA